MPIRSTNGSRPGRGGAAIADWLSLQAPGADGERRPVTILGQLNVAEASATGVWSPASASPAAIAYATANPMPPGSWTAPSVPQRWYSYQSGLETAFAAVNSPGNIWFNNSGGVRSFMWEVVNQSGRPADRIRVLLPNAIALASSVRISAGVGGSGANAATYTTPTAPLTIMAAGAQGETQLGMTLVEIDLPAVVAPDHRVVLRVEGGAGVPWTGISSFAALANPDMIPAGPDMSVDGLALTAAWETSNIGVGMQLGGVQWRVTTGAPIVRAVIVSDSRGTGVPPVVDPNANSRESWPKFLNDAEAVNGQRYCLSSMSEGGYAFDDYCDRIEYLIANAPSVLQALWDIVFVDLDSWNSAPTSAALAQAQQARFLAIQAALLALGIACLPLIITPPGADRQTAGHMEGYDSHVAFVAAQGGVNLAPTIVDSVNPYDLDASKSLDRVHVNTAAAPAMGVAAAPLFATAISTLGYF